MYRVKNIVSGDIRRIEDAGEKRTMRTNTHRLSEYVRKLGGRLHVRRREQIARDTIAQLVGMAEDVLRFLEGDRVVGEFDRRLGVQQ